MKRSLLSILSLAAISFIGYAQTSDTAPTNLPSQFPAAYSRPNAINIYTVCGDLAECISEPCLDSFGMGSTTRVAGLRQADLKYNTVKLVPDDESLPVFQCKYWVGAPGPYLTVGLIYSDRQRPGNDRIYFYAYNPEQNKYFRRYDPWPRDIPTDHSLGYEIPDESDDLIILDYTNASADGTPRRIQLCWQSGAFQYK
ncbi:MAG: hypothetical protein LIP02_03750 [Bacteroidales bacterium]|nr:hypothetical protein [Bacteroidales bacterium]